MSELTLFYSWASDHPNSTNRSFVERAIERAAKNLKLPSAEELSVVLNVDRDTRDLPGAPDISEAIFQKIRESELFIADVSIINPGSQSRPTPNPNVIIEVGYAASELGWDRVVLVMNEAFGRVETLPFDLRHRRIEAYNCSIEESDKTSKRQAFGKALERRFREIFETHQYTTRTKYRELLADELLETSAVLPDYYLGLFSNRLSEVLTEDQYDVENNGLPARLALAELVSREHIPSGNDEKAREFFNPRLLYAVNRLREAHARYTNDVPVSLKLAMSATANGLEQIRSRYFSSQENGNLFHETFELLISLARQAHLSRPRTGPSPDTRHTFTVTRKETPTHDAASE